MAKEIVLTPEQEAIIPQYVEKYNNLIKRDHYYKNWNEKNVWPLVDWQYKLGKQKIPLTICVENPFEAQILYSVLLSKSYDSKGKWIEDEVAHPTMTKLWNMRQEGKNRGDSEFDALYEQLMTEYREIIDKYDEPIPAFKGDTSEGYNENYVYTADIFSNVLIAWYGYLVDVVKVETDVNELFKEWRSLYEAAGVYNALCAEKICIVSRMPKKFYFNNENQLHNDNGLAVEWSGKTGRWKNYFINGRQIASKDYELALNTKHKTPNTEHLTRDTFMNEQNEDTRAAWYEVLGGEGIMELLGATEVDTKTIVHNDGSMETHVLYKTTEVFEETGGEPLAWVKFICPSTGTNYLIDVEPHHTDATLAAASTSPFFGAEIQGPDDYKFDARA